jgi:hypothetical protein
VVGVAALTACGGASRNGVEKLAPAKALAKVQTDLATVKWVHVTGHITQQGQTLVLDVHLGKGEGEGTFTVNGATFDVRLLAGSIYVKGSQAALTSAGASSTQAAQLDGKWIKGPATTGSFSGFAQFLDLSNLEQSLLKPSGTLTAGRTTTLNGAKAYTLVDTSPTNGGTLYVADTGRALPLRITKSGGAGEIDFSDYDSPVPVVAPSGAVDSSTLGQ